MKHWFDHLFRTRERKASSTAPLFASAGGRHPLWTPRQYDTLAHESYQKNIIVYRCVSLIARGVGSVPWKLYEGEHLLEDHPLLTLIQNPNPQQGLSRFMESLTGYLLLAGNVYIEAVIPEDKPRELYLLRPDRMKIVPSNAGHADAYIYSLNGKSISIPVHPITGKSRILHIKTFNPLNDWYGMSPVEAAAHAIDQHNAVATHNISLLQNGGRLSGIVQVNSGKNGEHLTDEQRQRLRDDLKTCVEGMGNSGRMLLLDGDFEWKEMGLSPKDLDFIEGKYLSAREIAQAYGIPPMLVGVPGESTFSNYKEARYHLWEDTILPYVEMIKDEINKWLTPFYQENLIFNFDTDAIPALAPKREALWDKIEKASFLTINEKRSKLGYSPTPNGDRFE